MGVVGISDDRAGRPYRGLDQSVFSIPYQCAVRVDVGGEGACGHVAVGVVKRIEDRGLWIGDGRILVQRVRGVCGWRPKIATT